MLEFAPRDRETEKSVPKGSVLDSITSIGCEGVVQQDVRLAVRLAACRTTCCRLLLWTCCWLSICCEFVVQLTNPQLIEEMESDT